MKKYYLILFILMLTHLVHSVQLPQKAAMIQTMKKVNDYWMTQNPVPGNNQWARAAYFTGCMDFYKIYPSEKYKNYMLLWAKNNNWSLNGGSSTRNADNQTCGQVYFDLFELDGKNDTSRIAAISQSIRNMVNSSKADDWWWVDALYMSMPVYMRMADYYKDNSYLDKMYQLYTNTKVARGLYNQSEHLWYRDESFDPPYLTPNMQDSYWSRGNGWVISAHVRVLQSLPANHPNRDEYVQTFREMAEALKVRQNGDGFWYASLDDSNDFGGPETSGTSFFTYALAWGINNGLLDSASYYPVVAHAWEGLVDLAVQSNGFLSYVQGVGSNPSSSQPVTVNSTADFGVGAFLLAGSELVKLAEGEMPLPVNFYLTHVYAFPNGTIKLNFNQPLDMSTATLMQNYSISGLQLKSVIQGENDSVIYLEPQQISPGKYTINIGSVKDKFNQTIELGTTAGFSYNGISSITASGFEPNTTNTPEKSMDFDLNTRWSCLGSGQWILYDLGELKNVKSLDIAFYNGASRKGIFKISLSMDNVNFMDVYDGMSSGTTTETENYSFNLQPARFVKITGYGNTSSLWNSITEVRIQSENIINSAVDLEKNSFKIWPNPLREETLHVALPHDQPTFSIFTVDGKLLFKGNASASGQIQIKPGLSTGFYLVESGGRSCKLIVD